MLKLTLPLLFLSMAAFSQPYEKGYYIDNSDNRIECLIKNKDKIIVPKTFSYKTSEQSQAQEASIENVKEFGTGVLRYVRAKVDVDMSTSNLKELKSDKYPEWKTETLFLKVLVEGKSNLYFARVNNEDRYFFNIESKPVKQLVYKLFSISVTQSGINTDYQYQLKTEVNCQKLSDVFFKRMQFNEYTLKRYFKKDNECAGVDYSKTDGEGAKIGAAKYGSLVHLKIAPGVDFAKSSMTDEYATEYATFIPKSSFRIGAEFELVFPIARNKWAAVVEPTYQSYKSKGQPKGPVASVTHTSLEIPVGIRHYFYLNKNASLFLNAQGVFDVPLKYEVTSYNRTFTNKRLGVGLAVGLGFKYRRFSVEGRYYTTTHTYLRLSGLDSVVDYTKTSVIAGFRVF